eukprot:g5902.t1
MLEPLLHLWLIFLAKGRLGGYGAIGDHHGSRESRRRDERERSDQRGNGTLRLNFGGLGISESKMGSRSNFGNDFGQHTPGAPRPRQVELRNARQQQLLGESKLRDSLSRREKHHRNVKGAKLAELKFDKFDSVKKSSDRKQKSKVEESFKSSAFYVEPIPSFSPKRGVK